MAKKTKANKSINIGCASNDSYSQHLGVMLFSLLKNCSSCKSVNIYVIDSNISEKNKKRLLYIVNSFDSKIFFIKPDLSLVKNLKICRHLGIETYYRFLLIENLDLDRLLYLDCDMVIESDIKELYFSDFEGKSLIAVKDPGAPDWKKKTLDIKESNHYFSGGVMLIDIKRWKKNNLAKKITDFIQKNPYKIEFGDQDGSNAILKYDWKEIDSSWNVITLLYYSKRFPFFFSTNDYTKSESERVMKNPKIIHYASIIKPWFFLDWHPLKSRYWHYLDMTPWRDYVSPDKSVRGIIKRLYDYFGFYYQKRLFIKNIVKNNQI